MRRLPALALGAALLACPVVDPDPEPTSCEPNPCTEPNRTTCLVLAGLPTCLCDPGFVPRPNGTCEAQSEANCPTHPGDGAEPDDCLLLAKPLTAASESRSQTIDPVGDYDYFTLGTQAAGVYLLTVETSSTLLPRLDLFDRGGRHLDAADFSPDAGFTRLGFRSEYDGDYYLRVSHSPADPSVATGAYDLFSGSAGMDDHGNTRGTATAITAVQGGTGNPSHPGVFQYDRDEDWFSFTATTTHYFRIAFDSGQVVPQVQVFTGASALPIHLFQQPVTDVWFDASHLGAGSQAYLKLISPPGGGSYTFDFTATTR